MPNPNIAVFPITTKIQPRASAMLCTYDFVGIAPGKENINIYGDGYIYDKLGDYTFKISPLSFYQINPIQTEKLYNLALEKAELTGKEILFDLYCGIGTIGISMASKAKEVYGLLSKEFMTSYDETGSIGKRYRRQDVIGTPFCITVDDNTINDGTVTIRDRDSMEQITIKLEDVVDYISKKIKF